MDRTLGAAFEGLTHTAGQTWQFFIARSGTSGSDIAEQSQSSEAVLVVVGNQLHFAVCTPHVRT